MAGTHAYYQHHDFIQKDNSCLNSPGTQLSICMEDSFTEVIDNDTSERHIVVQRTPKKETIGAPLNSGFMAGARGGSISLNSSHGLMNSNHFYKSQGVGSQKG